MTTMTQTPPAPAPTADVLEDLIDRYTDNLMRGAFSLGFPDSEAEELVQDTFVAFLQGGARFRKRSQILTYLFGILYNKAREHRRYQNRHDSIDASIDAAFDGHFDSEEHWNKESMDHVSEVEKKVQSSFIGRALEECLESLTAVMRMAFTMREVEGCATGQICMALGLSTTNLGVTLFRARNKLRECLTAKGTVIV